MSFRKRSQLDLYSFIHNKEAIWLYAELFLGHHDGSCHGLWWFVVICGDSCHGKLMVIYSDLWWFMSSFVVVHVMVCGSSVKNSLRYWPKHAFSVKTWVVTPHSNCLEKLTLLHEGFVQICWEFTEILTEMCSFSQNMGLLPLILIVSKS